MKKIAIIILLFLISSYEGYCQLIESAGPNSSGLAGLNANNVDVWSINYNVGQLQNLERSSIAVSFHQPFLLSDFTTANMVLAICSKKGTFGLNYSNYGNEYFQINSTGFGYAMQLGENITSGVKLNYHHINSGEFYNSKSILSTDIGFAANLTNELHLGFSLINPTFSKIDDYANERIPTVLQFAAGYHFSSELSLQAGVKKDMIYPLSFITAILYSPNEKVSIRGGVGTNPSLASLGINVHLNQIQLIFATQIHQILGWSPDFGIAYQFN